MSAEQTPNTVQEYVGPEMRQRLAAAWFAGYEKGSLDGYFGTRDERAASPYADLDPYLESHICGVGGPREALSDCIRTDGHAGEHRDGVGGEWPVAEQPRYRSGGEF